MSEEDLKSESYYYYYKKLDDKDNYPKPLYIPKSNSSNDDKKDEGQKKELEISKEDLIKFLEIWMKD